MSADNILMVVQRGQKWQIWECDFSAMTSEPCYIDDDLGAIAKWITQNCLLVVQADSPAAADLVCDRYCEDNVVEYGWSFLKQTHES